MNTNTYKNITNQFRESEELYKRVVKLSEKFYAENILLDTSSFVREAEILLQRVKGTDTVMGIFNHKTWSPIVEVGADEFWGEIPGSKEDRIKTILGYLEKGYETFPVDSVKWLTSTLLEIPPHQRINFKFHHCGIRYKRPDGKRICIISQGMPFQYDNENNFTYTFNYVQNVFYLLKKDFRNYWIRMSYGPNNEFVRTYHSDTKEYSSRDLLSSREKEIIRYIADDLDTKEIADRLSISPNTVGNHRSHMIERLGARDTTALVQLAKMACII